MKGKKIDSLFLSEFISKCIKNGFSCSEEILNEAKQEINSIDFKIKEVENLKKIRSKLLDVISTFDKSKKDNSSEKKILDFLNISNSDICKVICDLLYISPVTMQSITKHPKYNDEMIACIKKLQKNNIIIRIENSLMRGELFEQYYNFLCESI